MPTLKEYVYKVRNPNSGGGGNRALKATDRMIAEWVREARAFLMYADAQKKGQVEPGWEQDLGCVTLESVDQADCAAFNWGEIVKKVRIPTVLDLDNNGGVTFFGLIDKRTRIYLPGQNFGSYDDFMPYKKEKWYEAAKIGDVIYVGAALTQDPVKSEEAKERMRKLCTVNIRIVASDPTLVQTCGASGLAPKCFDEDVDCYPVPPHLEGAIFTYIDQKYINPKVNFPKDLSNDEVNQSAL